MVISILAVTFDISERIDDFIRSSPPLSAIIFQYYINFLLYYLTLMSNLIMFLACLFFTARLSIYNEIIAMMSLRYSTARIILPYILVSTGLSMIFLLNAHYIVPISTAKRVEFENLYIRGQHHFESRNSYIRINPEEFASFSSFNYLNNTGYGLNYIKWKGNEIVYRLTADIASFDTSTNKWHLKIVKILSKEKNQSNYAIYIKDEMDTILPFNAENWKYYVFSVDWLTTPHLVKFIQQRREEGDSNLPDYEITLYTRTAMPLSCPAFAMVGFLFGMSNTRKQRTINVMLGILSALFFIFMMRVFNVYAINTGFSPLWASFLPPICFILFSLLLYFFISRRI